MRRFSAVLAISFVALTACGSDSDSSGGDAGGTNLSGADQELADAIAADIRADEDGLADAIDADCLATGTVSTLGGAERIEAEYGITAENPDTEGVDLSADDASKVAAAYGDCGDLKQAFVIGFTADGEMTSEQAECVLADVSADDIEAVFEETLQGIEEGPAGNAMFEAMIDKFVSCAE